MLVLNAFVLIVNATFGGGARGGPRSSSFTTGPSGVAAYAALLERSGHQVQRIREAPSGLDLDPDAALLLLEPAQVSDGDVDAIRAFLDQGGRLVAAGADIEDWGAGIFTEPPQ